MVYLPAQLSDDEIDELVKKVIADVSASSMKKTWAKSNGGTLCLLPKVRQMAKELTYQSKNS